MDGWPERLVDYFVVVGLGGAPTPFRHVEEGGEEAISVLTAAEEPVTDVLLISKKHETCPKGYQ